MPNFIPVELAELAKSKGFNPLIRTYYNTKEPLQPGFTRIRITSSLPFYPNESENKVATCTYQQLADWVSETFGAPVAADESILTAALNALSTT